MVFDYHNNKLTKYFQKKKFSKRDYVYALIAVGTILGSIGFVSYLYSNSDLDSFTNSEEQTSLSSFERTLDFSEIRLEKGLTNILNS